MTPRIPDDRDVQSDERVVIEPRGSLMIESPTRESLRRAETEQARHARADAALRDADRLKDDLVTALAHELRTPLSVILGWARVLRSAHRDRETTDRALEGIERNVHAQTGLIEELLDTSRILSRHLRPLEIRPVDLAPVIVNAVETIRPASEAKAIRLDTVLDPRAGPVSADAERLQQIVRNLVSNAVKFTPMGGSVRVRLERNNAVVEIGVSDTGPGLAPEVLPHVFERFRDADGSTGHRQGGLGLRLAIARHLTELLGGTMRAESAGLGRGATFTVSFPARVAGEGPAGVAGPGLARVAREGPADTTPREPGKRPESADGVLAGITVLVVDDEEDSRETLRLALGQRGAEVRTAAGGAQALDLLAGWTPDVLVSDTGMLGEDDYTLIRRIRALSPGRAGCVPAVALTAYARPDRMHTQAAGFQAQVPKPVDPDELALVITRLTGLSQPASP